MSSDFLDGDLSFGIVGLFCNLKTPTVCDSVKEIITKVVSV